MGHGGHVPPHFYKWLGTGGTVSRRTANNKLTKLYWPSRKRSPKQLIVLLAPQSGREWPKNYFSRRFAPDRCPHFCSGPVPHLQFRSGATVQVIYNTVYSRGLCSCTVVSNLAYILRIRSRSVGSSCFNAELPTTNIETLEATGGQQLLDVQTATGDSVTFWIPCFRFATLGDIQLDYFSHVVDGCLCKKSDNPVVARLPMLPVLHAPPLATLRQVIQPP